MGNTQKNKDYGISRLQATKVRKNGTHRFTGKNRYRIYSDHKQRDTQVKMTLNNGRHVADGKLEGGWCISILDEVGSLQTFKNFKKAKEKFEELTHGTAPEPDFNHNY